MKSYCCWCIVSTLNAECVPGQSPGPKGPRGIPTQGIEPAKTLGTTWLGISLTSMEKKTEKKSRAMLDYQKVVGI